MADFERTQERRIAAALLHVRQSTPVRWEGAVCAGDPQEVPYCYCVDSAMGSFMDEEAAAVIRARSAADDDYQDQFIDDVIYLHPDEAAEWFEVVLDAGSGLNMVAFDSGWGDGGYPSYWGYDATGEVACLLTDFGLLENATFVESVE